MPVGTQGTVKGVHMTELEEDINTNHFRKHIPFISPSRIGNIRTGRRIAQFNTWNRPILTDSGGFQVFSFENRKLHEGRRHVPLTYRRLQASVYPGKVMDIQRIIGADIIMAFDECCPGDADYEYAKKSLGLTERWLDRCFERSTLRAEIRLPAKSFPDCTRLCLSGTASKAAENVAEKGADGNAIGGLAVRRTRRCTR